MNATPEKNFDTILELPPFACAVINKTKEGVGKYSRHQPQRKYYKKRPAKEREAMLQQLLLRLNSQTDQSTKCTTVPQACK
jgi:hypothetical protein